MYHYIRFLRNGDDIQKVSILYGLPDLFKVDANATCTRIIPKILQELQASSCEFHIASSKSLKFVIEKRLPINVIPSILQGLESKDPVVVRAWLDMLVDVMGSIPEEVIRKEVVLLYFHNVKKKIILVFYRFYQLHWQKLMFPKGLMPELSVVHYLVNFLFIQNLYKKSMIITVYTYKYNM